ncbi:hypothetical protein HK096_005521 [Nowakowskiella sp. JEL0078]|nr:hypothetical protein HK096_005521 [Nowakowskiella sp. JEL0078]
MSEKVQVAKSSIVCEEAELRGSIRLGENNMLHPKCRIVSESSGEILIGSNNIFEENCSIINRGTDPMIIGDDNLFEVGSVFEGIRIGNGCVVESKGKRHFLSNKQNLSKAANVSRGTVIGDNCVIGPLCSTQPNEDIPSDTVIYGGVNEQRTQTKATKSQSNLHTRHLDFLKE